MRRTAQAEQRGNVRRVCLSARRLDPSPNAFLYLYLRTRKSPTATPSAQQKIPAARNQNAPNHPRKNAFFGTEKLFNIFFKNLLTNKAF